MIPWKWLYFSSCVPKIPLVLSVSIPTPPPQPPPNPQHSTMFRASIVTLSCGMLSSLLVSAMSLPNQTLGTCESCEVLFSREQIPHLVMILLALGFSVEFALRCFHLAPGRFCFPLAEFTNAIFHWQPAFSWQWHIVLDLAYSKSEPVCFSGWVVLTHLVEQHLWVWLLWLSLSRQQGTASKKGHANSKGVELLPHSDKCRIIFSYIYRPGYN